MAAGEPYVVNRADLAVDDGSPEFVGADHGGGARICLILVDARPGSGPRLHRHPYEEVFVVLEGRATYVERERELEARAGTSWSSRRACPTASSTPATARCARSTST